MNVQMVLHDARSDEEAEFFSKLRQQGIPTLSMSRPNHSYGSIPWYVSSKFLIETLQDWSPPVQFIPRKFLVRERDVTLVMMLSQYRVEVLPMGGERP